MYGIIDCDIMATFFREKVTASTVTSIILAIAVHEVGATPTAIMGALEPLTAVAIGVMVFDESVLLIVMGKSFHLRTITHTNDRAARAKSSLLRLCRVATEFDVSSITTLVRKTWRWKS